MNYKVWLFIVIILPKPAVSQIPVLQDHDDQTYLGYDYGAAGIVDALLFHYNRVKNDEVLEAITTGLDKIWSKRVLEGGNQYPLWQKLEGGDIYTGIKYGSAGMAKTFIHAYEVTGNSTYLTWAEQAMTYLYAQRQGNPPFWGYALINATTGAGGIGITDYRFGSTGIISILLDLFEITDNTTYLSMVLNATSWLASLRVNSTVIPWYAGLDSQYTSLFQGNAGVLDILIRLSEYTVEFDDWMQNLVHWYTSNQRGNGSWDFNLSYPGIQRTSLDLVVAGIVLPLLAVSVQYLELIKKAYSWLTSTIINNATHVFIPEYPDQQHAKISLYSGEMGVVYSFAKLYESIPESVPGDLIKETLQWLLDEKTVEISGYQLIAPVTGDFDYIDLSFSDGNAGIIYTLELMVSSGLADDLGLQLDDQISELVDFFINTQQDGLWPKQMDYKQSQVLLLVGIGLLIPLLIYLMWKSKVRND